MSFGMRHRAAMGVSEESDAIVVVVSEETGAISVFHNARVKAGLSATELKAELIRLNTEGQQEAKEKEPAEPQIQPAEPPQPSGPQGAEESGSSEQSAE